MNASTARQLLDLAEGERNRLRRHLLVAAAFREVLRREPVVVGGTAEEYWTGAGYHETDLDLCAPLGPADVAALRQLGFRRSGRHWERAGLAAVVEFPDSRIDGDAGRTVEARVGPGSARIIGLDDLYLDRLRQATADERPEGIEFNSALAIVAARYDEIDWPYVRRRIGMIARDEPLVARLMRRIDSRIRRRVRERLTRPQS